MQNSMAVLWLYKKQEASRCPQWHNKAEPVSEAGMSNHKSGEVPVACTAKVCKMDEPREAVGQADDA